MNIYKLIGTVNKYNYVNHPYLKRDLDYNSQHSYTNADNDEFSFMKRKKLSTTIYGSNYNDDYLTPKINVISNAMKVNIEDKTPLSKRIPEVMQNPYIPFGDPNTKYDELLAASQQMLASVEPINYFGCRIVGDSGTESTTEGRYLYNFDIGMIFKIIPKDFLARYIDPTMIKESTVYVDSRSAMIMSQKSAFKNIWMDTKRYIPINPKYVEAIDINSLINAQQQPLGVNLNEQPISSYYTTPLPLGQQVVQPVEKPIAEQPIREPVEEPIREPIITEQQPKRKRRTNKKKQQSEPSEPFVPDIPTIPILDDSNVLQYQNNEEKDMPVDEETIELELKSPK